MRKGQQTRAAILRAALELAGQQGLESLSIGALAEKIGMSKSGVFAHFGAREDLQLAVLQAYTQSFTEEVFLPSIQSPRGLPRLNAMFTRWVDRCAKEITNGCLYVSGAVEYDDRDGPIREALLDMVKNWQAALARAVLQAIDMRQLRADTNPQQIVFEMQGLVLAFHHDARFVRLAQSEQYAKEGFNRLMAHYQLPSVQQKTGIPMTASHSRQKQDPSYKKSSKKISLHQP